jgi:hypothetical protein
VLDLPTHLRLALALAHSLPGGALQLHTTDGAALRAAHGGEGDLTPCELRAALLSRACPLWPSVASRITTVDVGGVAVRDLGGGLYGRAGAGARERWFATLLAPSTVSQILDECPVDFPMQLDASLPPDVELGVVVAVLSGDAAVPECETVLDDAARWASAACFTQELLYTVHHASDASDTA